MSAKHASFTPVAAQRAGHKTVIQQMRSWWYSLPHALRAPGWLAALAALTIVFQLIAFHQIVTQAVRKGEELRAAYPMAVAPADATSDAPINTALSHVQISEITFVR